MGSSESPVDSQKLLAGARTAALEAVPPRGKIGAKLLAATMRRHWEVGLTKEERQQLAGDLARNGYASNGSALPALIRFAADELDTAGHLVPWKYSPPAPKDDEPLPRPIRRPSILKPSAHSTLSTDSWSDKTVLTVMGYRVGKSGKSADVRRNILRRVYEVSREQVAPEIAPYLDGWGGAATPQRLNRMINTVTRNIQRAQSKKRADQSQAISDWKRDISWMRRNLGH